MFVIGLSAIVSANKYIAGVKGNTNAKIVWTIF